MRKVERAACALMLLALAGCGAMSGGPAGTVQPANTVTVSREQGGKFIALVGPRVQHDEPFLGVPSTNFFTLRSWIDTRTGEIDDQLYVEDSYFGAKRSWNAASTNGQVLRFVPISNNEISCEHLILGIVRGGDKAAIGLITEHVYTAQLRAAVVRLLDKAA